jgi:hypothetical protein
MGTHVMANARSVLCAGLVGYALLAPSTSVGTSVSAGQAALDVASAFCGEIDACSSFLRDRTFGDAATCRSRISLSYSSAIEASGSGWTPSTMEACAQAIPKASCDDALGHYVPRNIMAVLFPT